MKDVWAIWGIAIVAAVVAVLFLRPTGLVVGGTSAPVIDSSPVAQGTVLSCGPQAGDCPRTSFDWNGKNDPKWQEGAVVKFVGNPECYEITGSDTSQFYCAWSSNDCLFVSPKPNVKEGESFSVFASRSACASAQ